MRNIVFIAIGLLLLSCQTVPENAVPLTLSKHYEVVAWTHPDRIKDAFTASAPTLYLEGSDDYIEFKDTHYLSYFQERDIFPLVYRTGRQRAWMGPEALSDYWLEKHIPGETGIAIDELGHPNPGNNAVCAEALLLLHEKNPDVTVYVWHTGPLNGPLLEAYQKTNVIPMLEIYTSSTNFLNIYFGWPLEDAKKAGILEKTIVTFGIENKEIRKDRWSYSIDILRKQIEYCLYYYPEIAGFSIFGPRATDKVLNELNDYLFEIDAVRIPNSPK